ncbi:MAG: signal peptidase I [Ruminococcaceae bacterium]|nr:signal peptidase I [Oscillospiraceae bacterium]
MQNKQTKGKKNIGSTILNVFIWIFVVFSMIVSLTVLSSTAFNNDGTGVPSLGGYSLITVQSDSMKPEFSKGALIVVKKATNEQRTQYKEGDVITYFDYQSDGSFIFVTHRVQKVEELAVTTYTVLGDNKDFDLSGGSGERVFCNDVLGHYTGIAIPGLGAVLDFIKTPLGFGLIIILPLIAFFLYELYNFIRTLIEVKGKPVTVTISQEDEEAIKKRAIEEYLRQLQQEENKTSAEPPASNEDKQE